MGKSVKFFAKCLLFALVVSYGATGVGAKRCPPCGTTPVPFPFSTDRSCGDSSYKIRCSADTSTLFFDTLNYSYTIKTICPSVQNLIILPPTLKKDSCISSDFTAQGFNLDKSLPFTVSSRNTVMVYNCSSVLLSSPLNCSSNSLCQVYSNFSGSDLPDCRALPFCCTIDHGNYAYSISLTEKSCSVYRSFVDLNTTQPLDKWLTRSGVALQWALPREPVCQTQEDCEDGSNTTCTTDTTSPGGAVKRCFCKKPFVWNPISGVCVQNNTGCSGHCEVSFHVPLITGLTLSLTVSLVVGILVFMRQRHTALEKDRKALEREKILNLNNTTGRPVKYFTSREMKHATNNFSGNNLVGAGGSGEVYRGVLQDGVVIAVKCAKFGNTKSTDQVLNEVRILSQVNHRNLVRLLGCCVDLDQPLMVYEFIPNGTLADHLHGSLSPLSWHHRLSIAHQTAAALAYLHFSAMPRIYHRDVKSSNILLDENLNAKVSDFGLSRQATPDLSHISTCAQGTLGYLDPEYFRNYQLTDKSDVYSFGVVLLELLTSQKAIDFTRAPDDINLRDYMQGLVEEDRLMEAVDPKIKSGATQLDLDSMKALGLLALSCLEEKRQNRPSMKEVAEEIEFIITLLSDGVDQIN
ncbi:Wall-associated kinase family protein [Rhynchospora pubera]|uniref:Wall-associated kinase family protein n=1 Tax=Rhynchospora pubera TaxID=906938 RepID=A0AAV8EI19_9POAL|nr:Wall-associated kinase family protein [Rhynchospora pubera]